MFVCMYVCMHVCVYSAVSSWEQTQAPQCHTLAPDIWHLSYVCMHVCMYVYMCVCIHATHKYTCRQSHNIGAKLHHKAWHTYMYVHTLICIYVYMLSCAYLQTDRQTDGRTDRHRDKTVTVLPATHNVCVLDCDPVPKEYMRMQFCRLPPSELGLYMCVRVCMYMYVCMYVCM